MTIVSGDPLWEIRSFEPEWCRRAGEAANIEQDNQAPESEHVPNTEGPLPKSQRPR